MANAAHLTGKQIVILHSCLSSLTEVWRLFRLEASETMSSEESGRPTATAS